ncbi:MAG: flagellar assembly protein FliH [Treponema sp.]|nr:flagellar assembly protein FliH [Treponema sp.]
MAKAVFRFGEVALSGRKVTLEPPTSFPELAHLVSAEADLEEAPEHIEEYAGPTPDDLRREADAFRRQWDVEKEALIRAAKTEADQILKEAEQAAFKEVKRKSDEAQAITQQARDEAEKIIAEAGVTARQLEADARAAFDAEVKGAREQGQTSGREAGFAEGKAEVDRLIERTQVVLERAQNKRAEILEQTEQEIINLVLLIARKVVKVISENQRNVIVSNVVQALRKVKGRGNILIRVNLADLKLSTEHTKDFINLVEGAKSVQVVEDSSVDEGGCIIETDFGEIDARIASQLAELEAKILEISPIKSKPKSAVPGE